MQFLLALFTAAAALAAAQTGSSGSNIDGLIAQVPQCAYTCLGEAAESSGCGLSDIRCMCGGISLANGPASNCLSKSCPADQLASLSSAVSKICGAVGASDSGAAQTATSNGTISSTTTAISSPSQTAGVTKLEAHVAIVAICVALAVSIF